MASSGFSGAEPIVLLPTLLDSYQTVTLRGMLARGDLTGPAIARVVIVRMCVKGQIETVRRRTKPDFRCFVLDTTVFGWPIASHRIASQPARGNERFGLVEETTLSFRLGLGRRVLPLQG